jgi:glucosylceramidase
MKKILLAFYIVASILACNTATNNSNKEKNTTVFSLKDKKVEVYTTADSSNLRLSKTDTAKLIDYAEPDQFQSFVYVDPTKTFQTFLGIGGALTDASAEVFAKLPKEKQDEFIQSYYDKDKGIGYTLARTNIHSCDFSSDIYTYIDSGDVALKTFNVKHDEQFRIPFIKKAIQAAGGKLILFASPWSPPSWMKDNHDILHGGKLKTEFYTVWANYFVKFIKEYEKRGIPIWGVTIQNEPMALQTWESCIFSADEERDFLKNALGPIMEKEGLGKVKIIVWDHNRNLMYQRASTILDDPDAAKYVWGVGFHWYEDWMNSEQQHNNVKQVQDAYPQTNTILTEACNAPFDAKKINDWKWGERYGKAMINDFNAGAVGWTDWNVLLDEQGGPNHVKNYCYAPVHADTKTGTLNYTNAYYYIGHLSKFIKTGAKRIATSTTTSRLLCTAFLNEDGKMAVVVLNQSNDKIPYSMWIGKKAIKLLALAHSIQTIVI